MTIEQFELARFIRRRIDELAGIKVHVERLKSRDNDQEFNELREISHSLIAETINRLEAEFKELGSEKK